MDIDKGQKVSSSLPMEKPLPTQIPLTRILLPLILITSFATWFTWRLSEATPALLPTITVARLQPQSEITCEWPKFSIWDHNQLQNATFVRSIECPTKQHSFASLDSSGFLTVSTPYSEVADGTKTRCSYHPLSNASSIGQGTQIDFDTRIRSEHDQFVVRCLNARTHEVVYEEAIFNPTARVQVPSRASREGLKYAASDPMSPSIAILIIDDVSRAHFARNLPKTMRLMREEDFFVPSRYSQSYSDAASNLELLLNGNDSTSLEKMMKDRNCLTFSNEEASLVDAPISASADIDTRPMHAFNKQRQTNEHCLASGKTAVSSVLSPLLAFSSSFRDLCTLSITRLRSPSNRTLIGSIDEELSSTLAQLLSASSNTAVFIVSPSGLKGRGLSGVVEGKSPMLAAWFPKEFRKNRNEHYSTFAWNMDKLITTRDVRETLRQLAEGSLPDFVEWKDWDEEHVQATSLLGEMLPEERNCTTLEIPEENCLCLDSDKKRNATINADGILTKRVFDLVESRAIQESCIEGLELYPGWDWINSYRMFEKEQDKESDDVEWLTIYFYAKLLKKTLMHGGNYGAGGEGYVWFKTMVRHYIASDRLEYVEAVIAKSGDCFAVHLERLCSLCYAAPFWSLSAPGPNKGFLLDTATAVV